MIYILTSCSSTCARPRSSGAIMSVVHRHCALFGVDFGVAISSSIILMIGHDILL